MKNPLGAWIFILSLAFPCRSLAAPGPDSGESGLAVILFLCFIGLIIVGQLLPGVKLFFAMIKGLFKKPSEHITHPHHK